MKTSINKKLPLLAMPLFLTAAILPAHAAGTLLTWRDHTVSEQGFYIERSTSSTGTFTRIGTVGANVTSFRDTTGTPNVRYYYRVRAYKGTWYSQYTNVINKVYPRSSGSS